MELITVLIEFILLGIAGGLSGIFYRNCLKPRGMIFNWLYYGILKPWAEYYKDMEERGYIIKKSFGRSLLAFIAYPLGYCIYCSTTWITFFLCLLFLTSWEMLPKWQDMAIGVIAASGVQHLVVCAACRWLIHKHPDLDNSHN